MGYMRHHAIVVTSYKEELLEQAWAAAVELGMSVSAITDEVMNGYRSFLVAPDGSNEGWDTSDRGDEQRAKFAAWLTAQAYDDGSTSIAWVEVQFADDEGESAIVRDSDELRRRRWAEEDRQSARAEEDLAALEERVGAKWAAAALARTQIWPAVDLDAFSIDTWLVNPGPIEPPQLQFPREQWVSYPTRRMVALTVCDRLLDKVDELTDEQWVTLCWALQYAGKSRVA